MKPLLLAAVTAVVGTLAGLPVAAALLVSVTAAPVLSGVIACDGPAPVTGGWRPPLTGAYTLTGGFDPTAHPAQDLTADGGPGPGSVVAAAAGTVTARTTDPDGTGVTVELTHGMVRGQGEVRTRYTPLTAVHPGLSVGTRVDVGHRLGTPAALAALASPAVAGTGSGGRLSFAVLVDGRPVDPGEFLAARGAPLTGHPVTTWTTPPDPPPQAAPPRGGPAGGAPGGGADGGASGGWHEGGVGFALPAPGEPRRASLVTDPAPIPDPILGYYRAAGAEYGLPWTLLAGIGMAETGHGRTTATSIAGARGLMQFLPATWAQMGVDGDGDGHATITSDADSVFSAARYLTASGAHTGPDGVRAALFTYNRADWYVNDVLAYAHAYGQRAGGTGAMGGAVLGDLVDCPPGPAGGAGDPDLPPLTGDRVTAVLTWARAQAGEAYVFGASGPDAWDCSSFVQAAFARIGVTTPRTAAAQRDWLAAGNGHRVPLGQERPGDLVFWDSYRGPHAIGHVAIVWDPAQQTTVEARSTRAGVGHFSYADCPTHAICEVWRVANITDHPHHTANSAASLAVNAAAARDTDPGDPDPPTGVGGGA